MDRDRSIDTKTRILDAALALFNAEGVAALSVVDIASALQISPGHLYYHFRGKPEILAALGEAVEEEIGMVLDAAVAACRAPDASLETLWVHLHILVEEAWDARFLYREAGGLALRYPEVGARLGRIAATERAALQDMLSALTDAGVLTLDPPLIEALAGMMTTAIAYHALQLQLEGDEGSDRDRVARAAAEIMLPAAAFATV